MHPAAMARAGHHRRPETASESREALRREFADNRPVVTRLAEACISLNVTPDGVTRPALLALGFTQSDLDEHFQAATLRANSAFLRDIADQRSEGPAPEPRHMLLARMRVAIGELLPSRQFVVTQLLSEGFSKAQIDICLREAVDRAGKDFSSIATPPCIREVA